MFQGCSGVFQGVPGWGVFRDVPGVFWVLQTPRKIRTPSQLHMHLKVVEKNPENKISGLSGFQPCDPALSNPN